MEIRSPVPLSQAELDNLAEFVRFCPGRLCVAVVPGSLAGDALIEALRERVAPMPVELAPLDAAPGQLGEMAAYYGETDTLFIMPLDGRRRFASETEAHEFWEALNFQRERFATGKVRTLFLLDGENDLRMMHLADDLREWARVFYFPDALAPRDDSERLEMELWKSDYRQEPVHAPVKILRSQLERARLAGFPKDQLARDYAGPFFEALVARGRTSEAHRIWEQDLDDGAALMDFGPEQQLALLHSRTMLANREHHIQEEDAWRDRLRTAASAAIEDFRKQAVTTPEVALPRLAFLLARLSFLLVRQNRHEEAISYAEEAVRLYRQLAVSWPDAFRPGLAGALSNLAYVLSDLGMREETFEKASEAVRLYRQLASARPDAFLPNLATSLNNVAAILRDLGRCEEALGQASEAVQLYRQLAATRPDAFSPSLAMSLNNLATMLSDLGRSEEALAKALEAVHIWRELATARPEAFLPDLARSLGALARDLSDLGQGEESLLQATEAVDIRRQLAAAWPDAFLADLAISLNNQANALNPLGRHEEALEKATEAVGLFRRLAAVRPDIFLVTMPRSLLVLSITLALLDRGKDASAISLEGITLLRPYFERYPQAHGNLMRALTGVYMNACKVFGAEPDMATLGPLQEMLARIGKQAKNP